MNHPKVHTSRHTKKRNTSVDMVMIIYSLSYKILKYGEFSGVEG